MRNLLALLLSFGVLQFSVAQDNRTMKDCPDGSAQSEKTEGQASYGEPFASIKENKQQNQLECEYEVEAKANDQEFEYEIEKENESLEKSYEFEGNNTEIEKDARSHTDGEARTNEKEFEYEIERDRDGNLEKSYEIEGENREIESDVEIESDGSLERSYEFEGENREIESDIEIDKDAEINPSMDNSSSFNNQQLGTQNQTSSIDNTQTFAPVANNEIVVEERESTLENVIEAPFKAGVTIVSEAAEGVGHIVGAPFKAIGKLFGRDDDDNNM